MLKPKSPLEKAAKQVREPYAQPDYRRGAMEKLFEIGTDEAYAALLKRFTINANGQIADESEKRDLVERLVDMGETAVGPLKIFVSNEKKALSFPIQALGRILSKEQHEQFLTEVLQSYEPADHRSVNAKAALVAGLVELVPTERAQIFIPYVGDHDDDVQFQALEALEQLKPEGLNEVLIGVCGSDEHASRIQRRAAQALVNLEVELTKEAHAGFNAELKSEFVLNKKNKLQKAGA